MLCPISVGIDWLNLGNWLPIYPHTFWSNCEKSCFCKIGWNIGNGCKDHLIRAPCPIFAICLWHKYILQVNWDMYWHCVDNTCASKGGFQNPSVNGGGLPPIRKVFWGKKLCKGREGVVDCPTQLAIFLLMLCQLSRRWQPLPGPCFNNVVCGSDTTHLF